MAKTSDSLWGRGHVGSSPSPPNAQLVGSQGLLGPQFLNSRSFGAEGRIFGMFDQQIWLFRVSGHARSEHWV